MVQNFAYIFRMKASVCENKKMRNLCECIDTYVRKYTWPKLRGVAMYVCVRACGKKNAKFNSKAISWFLRKFAPSKNFLLYGIPFYTMCHP